uniref:Sushi domain-containing protein n=1 Tax=Chromera velia CCMP2878 TaxID=1169474 RepID=A0A0G4I495_9ALVE|eukprot:Cvel_35638.t1-p1 / transcript=Cvel_35638.t1 / gene=Cvel_35638 / organism=Chromera_velia_CCMP2878 / gene_product=hypothetical protein / transcript_product=hypothetical protein / location=Cvel_scaffold6602:119-2223(-) / protein_length=324 / sequence_SO=supercontig / SO=protein_coding / is_pseudo=false
MRGRAVDAADTQVQRFVGPFEGGFHLKFTCFMPFPCLQSTKRDVGISPKAHRMKDANFDVPFIPLHAAQCPRPPLAFAGYILEDPSAPSVEEVTAVAEGDIEEVEGNEGEEQETFYRPETFLTVRCNETNGFFTESRFKSLGAGIPDGGAENEEDEAIMCVDGAFEAIQTACRRPCVPISMFFESLTLDVKRYVVTTSETYHSVKVGISCAPGYQPISGVSPDATTCLNGTWTLFSVRCEPICDPFHQAMMKSDPKLFGALSLFGEFIQPYVLLGNTEATTPGSRLAVTCNEGFVPIFQSVMDFEFLECVGGTWTERTIECESE